jgi:predicted XRE-type DNA-binding protein
MVKTAISESEIQPSSGNVFADLNIPNPDQYLAKAELAAKILDIVQRRRLSQSATGKLLGITQPKVSALLNGWLDGFSTERLFRFLNALGCDVSITVSRPRSKGLGRVEVLNPPFQALLDRSRRNIKQGKVIAEKDFWAVVRKRAELRKKAAPSPRSKR